MRIIQISDTHISAAHQHFAANLAATRAWLAAEKPQLIIHTGDVTMNGALGHEDFDAARVWGQDLQEMLGVPGNHDVGDMPDLRADQPISEERLARARAHMGADRFSRDIDGWRLIGLNAMLCGSGLEAEADQEAWLAQQMLTPLKIALFLHKPLFIDDQDEGPRGYWSVKPAPRQRLLHILGEGDVRLISSGHLHIHRQKRFGETLHVWCPSSAFICGDCQEELGGERLIGLLVHDFTPEGHSCAFVRPEGVEELEIDPHLAAIYPPPAGAEAS